MGIIRNYSFNLTRNIHTLIFETQSKNQYHNLSIVENNIKILIEYTESLLDNINHHKHIIPKNLRPLLLINIFTKGYINNIKLNNFKIINSLLTNVSKKSYLKLISHYLLIKTNLY